MYCSISLVEQQQRIILVTRLQLDLLPTKPQIVVIDKQRLADYYKRRRRRRRIAYQSLTPPPNLD